MILIWMLLFEKKKKKKRDDYKRTWNIRIKEIFGSEFHRLIDE